MQKLHVFENDSAILRWVCDICECVYTLDVKDYSDNRNKEALETNAVSMLAQTGCGEVIRYNGQHIDLCGDCFKDVDTYLAKMYTALVTETKSQYIVNDDDEGDEDE